MSQSTASDFFRELKSSDEFHVEMAKLEFALELKRVMDRDDVTKTELADRLKVSKPMISKLLRGDANVTIETMVKASRSLGGQLFIKIVREGCSARLFELAKTLPRVSEAKNRVSKDVMSQVLHLEGWHLAANDFEQMDYSNENQPVAA